MESIEAEAVPVFRDMVTSGAYAPDSGNPVTCIIADAIFSFTTDIATKIAVPLLYFDTISPCCVWVDLCLPDLIAAEELPFKGASSELYCDTIIDSVKQIFSTPCVFLSFQCLLITYFLIYL